ncbi:MAG TPA: hypothetical protein VNJ53_10065 [Gaiellaceae bacterium]|nr:hypothetical protein [Gaiellaceae bacterium]
MTPTALIGLLALNVFVLVVGCALLWALRGWRSWIELFRLAGLAYLLGAAALMIVFTWELVVGIPFDAWSIVVTGCLITAAGVWVGRLKRRPWPTFTPHEWRLPGVAAATALFASLLILYFHALLSASRLNSPGEDWDAWRAWTLRAKGIYFYDGLDVSIPSLGQYPSYPPGISALQAAAFEAMGSADVVTLHLLNPLLAIGFVAAVVGTLAPRIHALVTLPIVTLLVVAPAGLPRWGTELMADLPLGFLVALAALLVVLWLDDRATWRLAAATVLLAGAVLTKREGLLFAVVVIAAGLVASFGTRRYAWPRLVACFACVVGLALPWRVWFLAQGLPTDAPEAGYLGFLEDLDRGWPSLRLVVGTMFDPELWLVLPLVGCAAVVLGLLRGARRQAVFAVAFLVLGLAGSTWVIWANPTFGITQDIGVNPVARLVGTTELVLAVLAPLLLSGAWAAARLRVPAWARAAVAGEPRWLAGWVVIVSTLAGSGASAVAGGMAADTPVFPTVQQCVTEPAAGHRVRVVFGYEASYPRANALAARVSRLRPGPVVVAQDGCTRVRVYVDPPTADAAARLLERARRSGIAATLEARPLPAAPVQGRPPTRSSVVARRVAQPSCYDRERAWPRTGGLRTFRLRIVDGRRQAAWAVESLGWVDPFELRDVARGAELRPAPGGPGFTPESLERCP